jgi:hypothetical protein
LIAECLVTWLLEEKRRWKEFLIRNGYDRFYPPHDILPSIPALNNYCYDKEAWRDARAIYNIIDVEGSSVYPKILDVIINATHDPLGYKEDVELIKKLWREVEREYLLREKLIITRTGKHVYVQRDVDKIMLYGDTFPIKDILKQKGFKWDPLYKVWFAKNVDVDLNRLMSELEAL